MKPHIAKRVLNVPWSGGNPYQELLYCACKGDYDPVMLPRRALTNIDAYARINGSGIVHLHWDDRFFGRDADPAINEVTKNQIVGGLRQFRAEGGRVLWTIHNRLPHKVVDLEAFKTGRQALVELADVVHVHTENAKEHMIADYGVPPEKLHVIAHPSYLGTYEPEEDTLNRPFCTDTDDRKFLFFGAFRGAKGIDDIVWAADRLTKRDVPYHLMMKGRAYSRQKRLLRQLGRNPNISVGGDRVPDEEIPGIFAQAQVFLAPYPNMFTSGSIMLAQTFGLPVIGPNIAPFREAVPEENRSFLYETDNPRRLLQKMSAVALMPQDELLIHQEASRKFAQQLAPSVVSAKFARMLDELVI